MIKRTPPTCDTQALDDINKWNCTLYVPKGSLTLYQAANQWKEFFFIEGSGPTGISNIESDGVKELKRYTMDGGTVKNSHKGINIIQMNDGTTKKVIVK